jgi:hypothetical protein
MTRHCLNVKERIERRGSRITSERAEERNGKHTRKEIIR